MVCRGALVAALAAGLALLSRGAAPPSFILISSPARSLIFYARLNTAAEQSVQRGLQRKALTSPGQLQQPHGLAVDTARAALYVADVGASQIMGMRLGLRDDGSQDLVLPEVPKAVVTGVSTRWIAIDSVGNLFFTSEDTGEVKTVHGATLAESLRSGKMITEVTTIYSGSGTPAISQLKKPKGIVADNFLLFWANGEGGTEKGSVVRAEEVPPDVGADLSVQALASNVEAAYGVCATGRYIFFSGTEKLYGMRHSGGSITTIAETLQEPRGCSWDGDGTTFVADKAAEAVYAFPSSMPSLRSSVLQKVLEAPDAYDVAILNWPEFSGAAPRSLAFLAGVLLPLALAVGQ